MYEKILENMIKLSLKSRKTKNYFLIIVKGKKKFNNTKKGLIKVLEKKYSVDLKKIYLIPEHEIFEHITGIKLDTKENYLILLQSDLTKLNIEIVKVFQNNIYNIIYNKKSTN